MEDLQSPQPIDKKTYLWSTIAGIIGFILINFFIISKIRYSDLGLFTEGIPISSFLHLLIGVMVGLISKTQIRTKALINAGVLFILAMLSPLLELNGILVLFGILSYLLGSLMASIFYKFSKKWEIIIGSVFLTAITVLISIGLPEISVDGSVRMEITPKKDNS